MATPEKTRSRGRGKDGLTERQRQAVVLIGPEETVWAGVRKCVDQGLITEQTFYNDWVKEDAFLEALNAERERIQGALADRIKARAVAETDRLFHTLIEIAAGERKANQAQIEAIKYVLDRAGIDYGGNTKRGNLFVLIQQNILNQGGGPRTTGDEVSKQ